MAQSVQCPTFSFGVDHDLTVHGFKPHTGLFADNGSLLWILSLSLCPLPLILSCPVSKYINELEKMIGFTDVMYDLYLSLDLAF